MHKKSFLAVVSGLILAMATYNALAFTCTDGNANPIIGQTIVGGVNVPDNAECTLINVTVNGNVIVGVNAALLVCSSTINGSVQGANSNDIHLGEVDGYNCPGNTINGPVTIRGTLGVELDDNVINGTVTLTNNGQATVNPSVEVENNFITGSLRCSGNNNITTNTFSNTVIGRKTGQCADF